MERKEDLSGKTENNGEKSSDSNKSKSQSTASQSTAYPHLRKHSNHSFPPHIHQITPTAAISSFPFTISPPPLSPRSPLPSDVSQACSSSVPSEAMPMASLAAATASVASIGPSSSSREMSEIDEASARMTSADFVSAA
eukprot:1461649-Pleurochrysis_carterae.AAC.1